jgi:hypothetical protein
MLAAAGVGVAVASSSAELPSYVSCAGLQGTMVGGLKSVTGHPQSAHVGDPLYGLGSLYSGAASQYSNGDLPPLQLGRFEARHLDASTSQSSQLRRDGIRADGSEHLPLWQRRASNAVPPPTPTWLAVPPHHARFGFDASWCDGIETGGCSDADSLKVEYERRLGRLNERLRRSEAQHIPPASGCVFAWHGMRLHIGVVFGNRSLAFIGIHAAASHPPIQPIQPHFTSFLTPPPPLPPPPRNTPAQTHTHTHTHTATQHSLAHSFLRAHLSSSLTHIRSLQSAGRCGTC